MHWNDSRTWLGWMCGACRLKMCWLHHMLLTIYSPYKSFMENGREVWKTKKSLFVLLFVMFISLLLCKAIWITTVYEICYINNLPCLTWLLPSLSLEECSTSNLISWDMTMHFTDLWSGIFSARAKVPPPRHCTAHSPSVPDSSTKQTHSQYLCAFTKCLYLLF